MRPEMTQKSIQNILSWSQLKSLTVVIDGLRNTANSDEKHWRAETINRCEQFIGEQFDLIVYDTNIGITDHVNRVQKRILPIKPNAIWVEEDFELNLDEFSNFVNQYHPKAGPFLLAGNSQGNHFGTKRALRTFFPPYWGQVLNIELTEEIEKLRIDKKIDPKICRDFLSEFSKNIGFPKKHLLEKQISYWNDYFNWATHSLHRWDALATYVLWSHQNPTIIPAINLVNDLASDDPRGMNTRHEKQDPSAHNLQLKSVENLFYCEICEHRKSRVPKDIFELVHNSLSYRGRILNERVRQYKKSLH